MDAETQSFGFVAQSAADGLYDLGSQLRKVKTLSNRETGTALAQELAALSNQTTTTTKMVLRVSEWPDEDLDPGLRKQKADLGNELERLLHNVREFQSAITERLKHKQQKQNGAQSLSKANESTPLLDNQHSGQAQDQQQQQQQQQQQVQVLDRLDQTSLDVHSALLASREAEIVEIQRGAHEINAIFQDLGILVSEQGQQLDTIEDNITDLARQTENAGRQLVRAENYQRSRGKWTCIALLVLLVITVLVAVNVVS